ncbi:MAG: potassium channel protein [Nocardioides sp.]
MRTIVGLDQRSRRRRRVGHPAPYAASLRRMEVALVGLAGVIGLGSLGYMVLPVTEDHTRFGPLDALYQTVTTVSTVGFREVHPLSHVGQIFTVGLIILGAGTVLSSLGLLVEAVTEGHLRQHLERRRMDTEIEALSGHVIVCGYGRVGRSATEQLVATGNDVVVIDRDPARFEGCEVPHLVGNVTEDDEILRAAGIERARALVGSLDSDAETVYLVLSARALAPDLIIVARARTTDSKAKMVLAGATRAVNPQLIGGRRLAAFALQPDVAEFLDVVVHDQELDFRIQQVEVPADSPVGGRTLADLDVLTRTGVQILAMRAKGTTGFTFRPAASSVVQPGCVLIGFGTTDSMNQLVALTAGEMTAST